ncbi:MAG: hypothetical protein WBE26_01640 [Phycisphaerae bacterium]
MMGRSRRLSLQIIDMLGGCTVAACLLGFVWLTVVRGDQTAGELKALTRLIHTARQDVRAVRAARDRQRALLEDRQTALADRGHLPTQVPIEEYFQTLSTLASRHRLRVIQNNPLAERRYPGLLEQRYAYEVTGSLPDLVGFLQSIESTDFWADVSYLKVVRGVGPEEAVSDKRVALLTLSLFAALQADVPSESGGA